MILGINAYHADASACVLLDGELVAAAEEERFRRIKHWAGFPREAVRFCLAESGADLNTIDAVGVNSDPRSNLGRRLRYALTKRPSPAAVTARIRHVHRRHRISEALREMEPPAGRRRVPIRRIDHHYAHVASSFLVSPFDEAVVVSVDGFGDFASAAWGMGRGDEIELDGRVYFPHSLGVFYEAMTQHLGFPDYGDEYKVMGLAAYGEAPRHDRVAELIGLLPDGTFHLNLDYFRHHRERIDYRWDGGRPQVGALFSERLVELLGPRRDLEGPVEDRHAALAASAQAVYERALFHLLNSLHRRYRCDQLALAGGCAMNSVANGRIHEHTPFKQIYLQPASGDAGGAIGAALGALQRSRRATARQTLRHAYLGPSYTDDEIEVVVGASRRRLEREACVTSRIGDPRTLVETTARAIATGEVVGWFQGRMEWGPRALGNRSIVCDPRREDMKDILNEKIKRRESFRPFAPSILRERVADWFTVDDEVPFMSKVYPIRSQQRSRIPAVTHVDGTGRLQTVERSQNPLYHALIEAFERETGVPMVLNTSFNENEPIVRTPAEALECFARTDMDRLVMGSWCITRPRKPGEVAALRRPQ